MSQQPGNGKAPSIAAGGMQAECKRIFNGDIFLDCPTQFAFKTDVCVAYE
jgi:hypothetical protein